MSISLIIGEYAICGIVGEGESMYIETDRCWDIYCNHVRKDIVEKDVPVSILKNAKWYINYEEIETPKLHDIVLHDFFFESDCSKII